MSLHRYRITRGQRPADDPLPEGIRQDTRKHTGHCLRPGPKMVFRYLANPGDEAWSRFRSAYLELLEERFREDRAPFDELAVLARDNAVHIGCNCPTRANPRVDRCHTVLALSFMQGEYPDIEVVFP